SPLWFCPPLSPLTLSDWIDHWRENEMSGHRHSIEIVFRVDSIANIFLDLVRDFDRKSAAAAATIRPPQQPDSMLVGGGGLLAGKDDWSTLALYVESLCQ